jgi:hypothetical protein
MCAHRQRIAFAGADGRVQPRMSLEFWRPDVREFGAVAGVI